MDGKHPISHLGPKNIFWTGGPEHYLVYGRPKQIPNKWVKQITMLVGWHAVQKKLQEFSYPTQKLARAGWPKRLEGIRDFDSTNMYLTMCPCFEIAIVMKSREMMEMRLNT